MSPDEYFDAVIIGGGFFGCCLALRLRERLGGRVVILEKAPRLLSRASYRNQARVHNGYHYPRSLLTAARSYANFPRFIRDFAGCVADDFEALYAVARHNSKVTARQFATTFQRIGAPIRPAGDRFQRLFDPSHIEQVFSVREFAFDAIALRDLLERRLEQAGVEIRYHAGVERVAPTDGGAVHVTLETGCALQAREAFNCTYSQINSLLHRSGLAMLAMKHELAEIALVQVPEELKNVGITVMDGMFFSAMPFPAEGLHSLSHVRYTPHLDWHDERGYRDPAAVLSKPPPSNFPFMLRDGRRFVPALAAARHVRSLFEVKTVLTRNEIDDGRPILLRRDCGVRNFSVIMGGKIDNIYDVLDALDAPPPRATPAVPLGAA